ncbi:hypothetical protein BH23VER1_BH23VER1_06000 [soil metagenome]
MRKDSGLFWWTVLITVMLGVATFCWFFSIYVFAHPEKPFAYRLLTKLEKIEPPQKFSALTVPTGQFLTPKEAYGKFYAFDDRYLEIDNSLLKRHYLTNYKEEAPLYMRGLFRIFQVRRLTDADAFTAGVVVRARSHDYPNVVVEYLFPSDQAPERPESLLSIGDDLTLDKTSTFASVIHIEKLRDDNLCFTLVPLVYGSYEVADVGKISLSPPQRLNLEAPWPVTDESIQQPDSPETEVTMTLSGTEGS